MIKEYLSKETAWDAAETAVGAMLSGATCSGRISLLRRVGVKSEAAVPVASALNERRSISGIVNSCHG
jgi:hypothetical protein